MRLVQCVLGVSLELEIRMETIMSRYLDEIKSNVSGLNQREEERRREKRTVLMTEMNESVVSVLSHHVAGTQFSSMFCY